MSVNQRTLLMAIAVTQAEFKPYGTNFIKHSGKSIFKEQTYYFHEQ